MATIRVKSLLVTRTIIIEKLIWEWTNRPGWYWRYEHSTYLYGPWDTQREAIKAAKEGETGKNKRSQVA